jgi:hypothetical protein
MLCGGGRDTLFIAALFDAVGLAALGAPRRILYVTATYGFRHTDSIDARWKSCSNSRESPVPKSSIPKTFRYHRRIFEELTRFISSPAANCLSDQQKADRWSSFARAKASAVTAPRIVSTPPEYGNMIGGY